MYIKFILREALSQLKVNGFTSYLLLSFLYIISGLSFVTLNNTQHLSSLYNNKIELEVFFSEENSYDDIQYASAKAHEWQWVEKSEIRLPLSLFEKNEFQINSAEWEEILNSLLPSLKIQGQSYKNLNLKNNIETLSQIAKIDEVLVNEGFHQTFSDLVKYLSHMSVTLLIGILICSLLISWTVLTLLLEKKKKEIAILKSLGASSNFILLPFLIFIFVTHTLAFTTGFGLSYWLIKSTQGYLQNISLFSNISSEIQFLTKNQLYFIWATSFGFLFIIGLIKSLLSIRFSSVAIKAGLLVFFIGPFLNAKNNPPEINNIKTQRIENEILLIHSQIGTINEKATKAQNKIKTSNQALPILARELQKNKVRLKNSWTLKNTSPLDLESLGTHQKNLIFQINKQLDSFKKNKKSYDNFKKQLTRRLSRLEKLKIAYEIEMENQLLKYKDQNQESSASVFSRQELLFYLKEQIDPFSFNKIKEKNNRLAISPLIGKIVYSTYRAELGHTLIVEHSPEIITIHSHLDKVYFGSESKISKGDIIGESYQKKPYFEIRYLNQNLPLWVFTRKGTQI